MHEYAVEFNPHNAKRGTESFHWEPLRAYLNRNIDTVLAGKRAFDGWVLIGVMPQEELIPFTDNFIRRYLAAQRSS